MGNNASSLASPFPTPFAHQSRRRQSSMSTTQASQPDEEANAPLTQESDTSRKLSFSDQDMANGDHAMERPNEHEDATVITHEHGTYAEERERPSDEGPDLASLETEIVKDTGYEKSEQGGVRENKVESQLEVQDDSGTSSDEGATERASNTFFLTQPEPNSRKDSDGDGDGDSDSFYTELAMENTGEQLHCDSDALDRPATQQRSDDESSSDESDPSSASEDSIVAFGDDYMEKVERNVRRNKERLSFLGFETKAQTPVRSKTSPQEKSPETVVPTGMLFATETAPKLFDARHDGIDEIYQRYPNRQFQIKSLVSLIGAAMGQTVNQGDDPYVPPPIFVSGPSGTGKTCIVREVIDTLKRRYSSDCGDNAAKRIVGSAYVNCATVEPSSLEAVLESAYSQLTAALELPPRPKRVRKEKRKRNSTFCGRKEQKMRRHGVGFKLQSPVVEDANSNEVDYSMDSEAEMEDAIEASKTQLSQIKQYDQEEVVSATKAAIRSKVHADSPEFIRRKTRNTRNGLDASSSQNIFDPNLPIIQEKKSIRKVEPIARSHGAPVAFGRVLVPLFGSSSLRTFPNIQPGSAFFVLDHAERLFSLSPNQTIETNNFFTQLLLLPQVMGLNLTFILVSRSTLLDSSSMHNSSSVQKALGTVAIGTSPIRIHFSAYQGNVVFKAILKQPNIVQLIVGRQHFKSNKDIQWDKFQESNIHSFLDTLVQSLSSVTRDVREMIRIGRMLWPSYILPLHPRHVQMTLDTARRRSNARRGISNERSRVEDLSADPCQIEELQKELLAILDEALLPIMKTCLEEDMFVMKGHDTCLMTERGNADSATGSGKALCHSDLPYLSKCLLLAAFVCQNNKSDKDKALFTIQRNGKKNSRKGDRAGDNDADALAYGSTSLEQQELKVLRPRTFSLERMLSLFVNIVGLIGGEEKLKLSVNVYESKDLLQSMGSICFFESLGRLRQIGLLHEAQGTSIDSDVYTSFEGIDLTSTKYWCELSRYDAEALAKSVDFPLDNFLL